MPSAEEELPTIIKADRGYFIAIAFTAEDGTAAAVYEPIIAWGITFVRGDHAESVCAEGCQARGEQLELYRVTPIGVSGAPSRGTWWAIKLPDGTINAPELATFENEQQMLDYYIETLKLEKEYDVAQDRSA